MTGEYPLYKKIGLLAGPVLFALILFVPRPQGMTPEGHKAAAITVLMAIWWITEALPLAATSLVPIALYPPMGVLSGADVTKQFGDSNIFLFAGGFFIAMAMQKWNLHERIALNIVLRTGTNPSRLVLGFLLATAFMSMWMSNTATTLMMMPIVMAIVGQMEARGYPGVKDFAVAVLLSIAYGAAIGGIATLIGTPPNGIFLTQYKGLYPAAPPIGFLQFMMIGVPVALLFIPVAWLLLTRILFKIHRIEFPAAREEIAARLRELGPMSRGEWIVFVVWGLTALGWIFSEDIQLGSRVIYGWSSLFSHPKYINHGTVAICAAVALFLIPVHPSRGEFALDWEWGKRIPWDVLLLFGGGLAMADAFRSTGLTLWVGSQLEGLNGMPAIVVIIAIATMLNFLTEITSNTATASIMLPILGGPVALALGLHPLLLMIPATLAVSCAFMLPVSTPPNAIVFAGGFITVPQMARAGFLMNLAGITIITLVTYFIAVPLFGIDLNAPPDWAAAPPPPPAAP